PPATVFAAVEAEARARGVEVLRSEVVGLIPERAVIGAAAAYLRLPDAADHLLEAKIREQEGPSLDDWIETLASANPVPGGGSAAALAGVLAAALVAMVARLTVGRRAYAAVEARARGVLEAAEEIRSDLRRLMDEDARAYEAVMAAQRLPKDDPDRRHRMDGALLAAAVTPLETARQALAVRRLARVMVEIGNPNARSDARVAEELAGAALRGALENVRVNLEGLRDPRLGDDLRAQLGKLEAEAARD
ncbi:MAG TPA: cyclodeaminase/cyclohydrolase family protein, partial [Gemmatimonadales bacterium]|nr:cyclodeaminase/cyclohydrolase family protein [Gemmatimonadales bacterium]